MTCPVCSYPHAGLGIPCGSCGGTLHGSVVIAESRTPIVPDLPAFPMTVSAAILGFAGPAVEAQPQPKAVAPVVEEVVAPPVEVAAPVHAVDLKQQPLDDTPLETVN